MDVRRHIENAEVCRTLLSPLHVDASVSVCDHVLSGIEAEEGDEVLFWGASVYDLVVLFLNSYLRLRLDLPAE